MGWIDAVVRSVERAPWPWMIAAWVEGALCSGLLVWWLC